MKSKIYDNIWGTYYICLGFYTKLNDLTATFWEFKATKNKTDKL